MPFGKFGNKDMIRNIYKNKTVVVTGDTGFKGSWLSIWLKKLGANVIGVSLPPKRPNDNYVICGLENKITHINQDIREIEGLLKIFKKYKPEFVFHLAAQSLVLESYKDPWETYSTNLMGTVNILETIRYIETVKSAVIVTSDKCYKNMDWMYGYRENDILGGKDPYSASKAACEIIAQSYMDSFFAGNSAINIGTGRAGNVIGGGDWADYRIVPDCISALMNKERIIIRNPNSVRPWQHVLEPLSGYLKLGSLLYSQSKKYVGPWNFGPSSNNIITVNDLVKEIVLQWGSGEISVQNDNNGNLETGLLHLDISKSVNKLDWKPKLDLKETIKLTIKEYQTDKMSTDEIYKQRLSSIDRYIRK